MKQPRARARSSPEGRGSPEQRCLPCIHAVPALFPDAEPKPEMKVLWGSERRALAAAFLIRTHPSLLHAPTLSLIKLRICLSLARILAQTMLDNFLQKLSTFPCISNGARHPSIYHLFLRQWLRVARADLEL